MADQNTRDIEVENLSEEFSMKLAAKLKNGELSAEKMAEAIQLFLSAAGEGKTSDELKDFINNF